MHPKFTLFIAGMLSLGLQTTQAFCIYNNLENESSSLSIYDTRASISSFKKTIAQGEKECCHYSNTDCNPSGQKETLIRYHVRFGFNGQNPEQAKRLLAICSAGGSLTFVGSTIDDARAICCDANGSTNNTSFLELFDI
ncbi:hypothetical protein INT48_002919 [Thamnidium elegans]|uniref:Uncharacterized protein n=1 Tax=Thamnidium elegans TaxID=101142 RepID=A0A8H7SN84_9FUNG|nr:hypothetical protein INT48_002919 [Thamnidium elegans]